MNIVVLGWYGHHNCGDESYRITMPLCFPGHEFRFVDKITNDLANWCDAVILGGGNVMRPYFLEHLQKINKPIYAVSVGSEGELATTVPFRHIFAREYSTLEMCRKAKLPCSFLPDLAFLLKPDPKNGRHWLERRFADEKLELYKKVVVVVINHYLINGSTNDLARDAVRFVDFSYRFAKLVDDTSASFVFIPFGTDPACDDRTSNAWVANKCKWWKKNYVSFERLGVQETLDIISSSDLVISTRLHSSIFSHSCGVPFIDLTHHSKNDNFLAAVGKKDVSISYWDFESSVAMSKIKDFLNRPKDNQAEAYRKLIQKETNAVHLGE